MASKNPHIGSTLDEFLAEDGTLEVVEAQAIKEVLAWQIQQEMDKLHLSKTEMASRMQTSRSSLNRLLDPDNPSVSLYTCVRAAFALGKTLELTLATRRVPRRARGPRQRRSSSGTKVLGKKSA